MKNLAKVSVFALFVAVMTVACNNAPKTEETTTSSMSTSNVTADSTAKTAATPDTTKK